LNPESQTLNPEPKGAGTVAGACSSGRCARVRRLGPITHCLCALPGSRL